MKGFKVSDLGGWFTHRLDGSTMILWHLVEDSKVVDEEDVYYVLGNMRLLRPDKDKVLAHGEFSFVEFEEFYEDEEYGTEED